MAGSCKNSKDISIHIPKLRKQESIYRMAEANLFLHMLVKIGKFSCGTITLYEISCGTLKYIFIALGH